LTPFDKKKIGFSLQCRLKVSHLKLFAIQLFLSKHQPRGNPINNLVSKRQISLKFIVGALIE